MAETVDPLILYFSCFIIIIIIIHEDHDIALNLKLLHLNLIT